MTVLTTSLDQRSEGFAANAAAMRALVADQREKIAAIRGDGGTEAWRRHLARGKSAATGAGAGVARPGFPTLGMTGRSASEITPEIQATVLEPKETLRPFCYSTSGTPGEEN